MLPQLSLEDKGRIMTWKGHRFSLTEEGYRLVHCLALCADRTVQYRVLHQVVFGVGAVIPSRVSRLAAHLRSRTMAMTSWPLPILEDVGKGYSLVLDQRHVAIITSGG